MITYQSVGGKEEGGEGRGWCLKLETASLNLFHLFSSSFFFKMVTTECSI